MKYKILFAILLFSSLQAYPQVRRARLSPIQKIEQEIGFTQVTIEYSRPSMKGRTIFGDLVPYGEMWRAGANRNTKITFNESVFMGEKELVAGTYALFIKPEIDQWELFFYKDIDNWDVPDPIIEEKIELSTYASTQPQDRTSETWTINIEDVTESTANLTMQWENTIATLPINFKTNEIATKLIEVEFERNADDYHIGAVYYAERNMDLNKAKNWMEKAMYLREEPHHWDYLEYSRILYKLDQKNEAIVAAKKSLELSKKIGSKSGISANTKSLKEWGAME